MTQKNPPRGQIFARDGPLSLSPYVMATIYVTLRILSTGKSLLCFTHGFTLMLAESHISPVIIIIILAIL